VDSHEEGDAMSDLIQHRGFKRASIVTADAVIRLLTTDAVAFGDEGNESRPRLTADERLARRKAVAR
jgi:hypothetical protein